MTMLFSTVQAGMLPDVGLLLEQARDPLVEAASGDLTLARDGETPWQSRDRYNPDGEGPSRQRPHPGRCGVPSSIKKPDSARQADPLI